MFVSFFARAWIGSRFPPGTPLCRFITSDTSSIQAAIDTAEESVVGVLISEQAGEALSEASVRGYRIVDGKMMQEKQGDFSSTESLRIVKRYICKYT